jgi:hypothetical protein
LIEQLDCFTGGPVVFPDSIDDILPGQATDRDRPPHQRHEASIQPIVVSPAVILPPISTSHFMSVEMGMSQDKIGSTIPHDRLRVSFDGSSAHINDGPYLSEKQAIVSRVRDLGFRESTARAMLKMAHENRFKKNGPAQEFRVEYAPCVKNARDPYLTGEAPTAPVIPEPSYSQSGYMGTDGGWTPVGPYVNADGRNSTALGKLCMKFIAGGTGIFGIFLTIKTDRG